MFGLVLVLVLPKKCKKTGPDQTSKHWSQVTDTGQKTGGRQVLRSVQGVHLTNIVQKQGRRIIIVFKWKQASN